MKKLNVAIISAGILCFCGAAQEQISAANQGGQTAQPAAPANVQAPASGSQNATAPTTTKPKTTTPGSKTGQHTVTKKPLTLTTAKDKTSYAIGMNIGKSLHRDSVDVDTAILAQGIKDALAGTKPLLTDQEAQAVMTTLQNDVRAKQQLQRQQAVDTNKKAGETFLAANKAKEGVVTLPSGLQYKILKQGDGPKPDVSDTVVCNYRGTLLDGTEFDSSYKRGQPATFPVGRVIKGWTEALQLMPVGSKWQLFIPADLAYGERGAGGPIGPDATLVFEVELLSIQDKSKPAQAAPPQPPAHP
jgi:FKBP-type peptidyl-prolyl cis-trans isomerase FklB